jgi:periplasmic divalent cation tolerance protein
MDEDFYQVVTTTDSEDSAVTLSGGIVEARLGACVHVVGPITSVYRWEGKIEKDTEWRCVVKTTADRVHELMEYIKANHSYDVPQIVATRIVKGSDEYLAWLREETRR